MKVLRMIKYTSYILATILGMITLSAKYLFSENTLANFMAMLMCICYLIWSVIQIFDDVKDKRHKKISKEQNTYKKAA